MGAPPRERTSRSLRASISRRRRRRSTMRSRARRRSLSNWVSPGPRVPTPPPSMRDRCDHICFETRQRVFQLGQFHLQLGLGRAGTGGEDVKDQFAAVDDLAVGLFLQVPDLGGRQVVVEDDDLPLMQFDQRRQFFHLAVADVSARMDGGSPLGQGGHDFCAGPVGQAAEFFQAVAAVPPRDTLAPSAITSTRMARSRATPRRVSFSSRTWLACFLLRQLGAVPVSRLCETGTAPFPVCARALQKVQSPFPTGRKRVQPLTTPGLNPRPPYIDSQL